MYGGSAESVSRKQYEIYKRLTESRQEALTGKLLNSKSNAIGILAALNHLYGWNDPGRPAEQAAPAALPADSLPLFDSVYLWDGRSCLHWKSRTANKRRFSGLFQDFGLIPGIRETRLSRTVESCLKIQTGRERLPGCRASGRRG